MDSLGLTVHLAKSVLCLSQQVEFSAFLLNSHDMTIKLTDKKLKVSAIVSYCRKLMLKQQYTIRQFSEAIGKLAAESGVLYAPIFIKPLEIEKDKAVKGQLENYDTDMVLSSDVKKS